MTRRGVLSTSPHLSYDNTGEMVMCGEEEKCNVS
jgi:hypothetical protein